MLAYPHPKCFKPKHLLFVITITCLSIAAFFFVNESPATIPLTIKLNTPVSALITRKLNTTVSTPITIKLNKIVFTPSTITCRPFTVLDNRSFFERESSQLNLPRRISNSSHQDLLHHFRSLRLIVVSCARNVAKHIDQFRNHIEPIVDLFHPSSRILIFESDSTDNTLAKLRQWSRANVYRNRSLLSSYPSRPDRIAYCRNTLLNKVHEITADYILVADLDIFATNVSSFLTNFDYDTNDWSVMTAAGTNSYYDIWALRTLSDSVLNFDVWHRVWGIERSGAGYCSQSVVDQIIGNNQKGIPIDHGLIEVRSAFGGAGLYKVNATYGCKYSGDNMTCEHVPFHLCMREKNRGRIFINPKFLIA